MKTTLTLNITTEELRAAARYQDNIQDIVVSIAKAFGKDIPTAELTNMKKLKLALGGSLKDSGISEEGGIIVEWSYSASRKNGFDFHFTMHANPGVVTEVFNMYVDVIGYYAPVVVSSITGLTAAAALAEKRGTETMKRLKRLSK